MSEYLKIAAALAVYATNGACHAIAALNKAGFTFEEALELLCAYDEAR